MDRPGRRTRNPGVASRAAPCQCQVFAGMAIAGKAVGAEHGILYLRAEYYWLRDHLEKMMEILQHDVLAGTTNLADTK